MKKAGWAVMTVLAVVIALYAAFVLAVPGFGAPFMIDRRALMPWAVYTHLAGGIVALAVGPWQLNDRIRQRALSRHRWMGRCYVVAVLIGGLGALALATVSEEGFVTHVGFGMLAILWLTATVQAYRRIRARDQFGHRGWMIRSYALTLAAVTLRIYLPASQLMGLSFSEAYQAIAWACWVPNLVVAEWIILRRQSTLSRS